MRNQRVIDSISEHFKTCPPLEDRCVPGCAFQFRPISIGETQLYVGDWAERKGWDKVKRSQGDWHALFHTEISESYEEYRAGREPSRVHFTNGQHDDGTMMKPEGIGPELADLVIRVLHYCAFHDIDLEEMIHLKMQYNETRSERHGNKVQ